MKKLYIVISILLLSVVIAACGQDTPNTDNPNAENDAATNNGTQNNSNEDQNTNNNSANNGISNTNVTEDSSATNMVERMESRLQFIEFELDVKYDNDQEYEADLELDNNRVEAKLEDDLNGTEIEGQGAFDHIFPRVEQLTIDQNTTKEEVIAQVLDAFELPEDYIEFELKITFKDGTKKEYDDR